MLSFCFVHGGPPARKVLHTPASDALPFVHSERSAAIGTRVCDGGGMGSSGAGVVLACHGARNMLATVFF